MKDSQKKLYENFPDTPGVYLMRGAAGKLLYVGKAVNLKRRVSSYFTRPHDYRIQKLVSEIRNIEHRDTDTAIEALILEAELIKKHQPPYNIREKDDKSFLFIEITREKLPRVLLVRGKDAPQGTRYGPFTSPGELREAMKIIRRIFPYSVHETDKLLSRPCFDYQIGLCPGTCIGAISRADYARNIRNVKLFLGGKKKTIVRNLEREMRAASKDEAYERAERIRRQLFALQHIRDVALIRESGFGKAPQLEGNKTSAKRIEGYDISNISGTSAVGSMVVFLNGEPDKASYRKFKIKTVAGSDDVGMIREVLARRFNHPEWPAPDLILVDGGLPQVNAGQETLMESGISIPLVGLAKGPERKRNDLTGKLPAGFDIATLIRVRDEAHRFAVRYHREVRSRNSLGISMLRRRRTLRRASDTR